MPIKPDFDLLDRNFYAADPWPVYAWLREFEPVYWDEKNEFWWVSRHEDVAHVSKHPELFSSAKGTRPNVQDPDPSMINQDDPRHTWVRSFVYKGFTPRRLGEQEKSIRAIAKRIVRQRRSARRMRIRRGCRREAADGDDRRLPGHPRAGFRPAPTLVGRHDPGLRCGGHERGHDGLRRLRRVREEDDRRSPRPSSRRSRQHPRTRRGRWKTVGGE